jgi:hypothetical protein
MITIRDRKLMDYLVAGLEDDGISKKFEQNKGVMALYAGRMEDVIVRAMPVQTYYLAHYGEQFGDLMSDPEVNFLRINGEYFPSIFKNDYIGRLDRTVFIENGRVRYVESMQKSVADFVNSLWLPNILVQQDITREEIDAYFMEKVERPELVLLRQKRLETYGQAETDRG